MLTKFKANGLVPERILKKNLVRVPSKFTVPNEINSMSYCLPASDQSDYPACVGYATAGYCEVQKWKHTHIAKQIDGLKLYKEAKRIEGTNDDGTTLRAGAQAAINLGYAKGKIENLDCRLDVQFALHRWDVCVGAFHITDGWNDCSRRTGKIPELNRKSKYIGYHGIVFCGYNPKGTWIQNSWPNWGLNGEGFAFLSWKQFDADFEGGVIIEK